MAAPALVIVVFVALFLVFVAWAVRRANPALALTPQHCGGSCPSASVLMVAAASPPGADAPPTTSAPATSTRGPTGSRGHRRRRSTHPSRRRFLRNSMAVGWLGVLGGFGGASLAFLWPSLRGGFGAQIDVDTEEAILGHIRENRAPYPYPAGRMYLVEYDPALDPDGAYAELTQGAPLMALYQVCPHLGCKVPWCLSSQWFECPCHGSRYNRWGEWRGGPAPRGMDRFALTVDDDRVIVDTSTIVEGPSRQAAVLDQPPEGPSCLGA